jgi:two-component system response regulator BaeR
MTKILLVEDDEDIVEMIILFLKKEGYEVKHIDDGAEVMTSAFSFMPDLIIMDIMLPNIDGLSCTEQLRKVCNVPIIMLTARVAQQDVITGLETGADDYLCKPFDMKELFLRIRALTSRTQGQIFFDVWSIDQSSLSAIVKGKKVYFSLIEFSLFELLFNSPGRVFSRDQIINLDYHDFRDVTDRAEDSHIKNLRKKLKQADIDPKHIQSVYGAGYRFLKDPTTL